MATNPITGNDPFAALSAGAGSHAAAPTRNDAAAADRFLKLLVTQMQNQDPLNPMDNAQITSQMAQINTVSGIEKLHGAVEGLNGHFVQMQALQGAALVGRAVTLQGSGMSVYGGRGVGAFDLGATADSVKVEVLNAAGRVVDALDLGAQGAGRHGFEWTAPPQALVADGSTMTFRVVARHGTTTVPATLLMRDVVTSVSTQGTTLTLHTANSGDVAYGDVKAFN